MPFTPLPRSSAESQGVDPAGIVSFLDAMEAAPEIEMHSLMIMRHGQVVTEGWWSPYRPELPHLLYSLSKSFTSTAAGFAVAEGLLDLDATVLSYFPELDAEITDPRSRSMLVRHIAAMASGHLAETWYEAAKIDLVEPVRGFLLIPPDEEPGTVFAYNQPCTYTLAAIVQRQSGQTLVDYLRPRLFDPLGIGTVGWQEHPAGRNVGFTGLHATTDAIARLALFYLQRGVWNGTRLLSEEWVAEATSTQVANPQEPNPDWRQGYGFQFWMARHGYRGDGAYGQFCIVLPEQDVAIATTAATENMQGILDAVWEHLLPAMTPAALTPSPVSAPLAERLSTLAIAPLEAAAEPTAPAGSWTDKAFRPAGGVCAAATGLSEIQLVQDDEQWQLILLDGDDRLGGSVGCGEWRTNLGETDNGDSGVPLAVSGGWTDADTFRVDLIFLETPHRLAVTCSARTATFVASWTFGEPLRIAGLSDLRMPR